MDNLNHILVIGLGKLGMPFAITVASRGFTVIGFDINKVLVNALNTGDIKIYEPFIKGLWHKNKSKIKGITHYGEAISNTDITFIIVPTPSNKNGSFSNKYIIQVIKKIAPILKLKKTYHLISLVSTVMPTSADKYFIPLLEKYSGKKVGRDFGFCYNPAFIALGNIVKN